MMKKHHAMAAVLAAVSLGAALSSAGWPADANRVDDRSSVLKANEAFFSALNEMFEGKAEPFEEVWWHTDEIVYMGADGEINIGWTDTYENWKKQAALGIGGSVEAIDVVASLGTDMAMTNQVVVGTNEFGGQSTEVKLRSTSVFKKKDDVWKMVCHHVDPIPVLGKEMRSR